MLEFQINLLNISTYFLNMVFNDSMINLYFYQNKLWFNFLWKYKSPNLATLDYNRNLSLTHFSNIENYDHF